MHRFTGDAGSGATSYQLPATGKTVSLRAAGSGSRTAWMATGFRLPATRRIASQRAAGSGQRGASFGALRDDREVASWQ